MNTNPNANNPNNEDYYIQSQISVYKTDKYLIEFLDRLNLAPIEYYAIMHSRGFEGADGRKIYSTIGVHARNYSGGTGDKSIVADLNISPEEALFIYNAVKSGMPEFVYSPPLKIIGNPDDQGYAKVTMLRIRRTSCDSKGQLMNYPWTIEVENGKGIKANNSNGGSYCQSNSYIRTSIVSAHINDFEFFKLMQRVESFIRVWETVNGGPVIKNGRKALEELLIKRAGQKEKQAEANPQPTGQPQQVYQQPHQPAQPAPAAQHQNPQPSPAYTSKTPVEQILQTMTMKEAGAVIVNFGDYKGKTLREIAKAKLEEKQSVAYTMAWYVEKYKGNNNILRAAARIIMDFYNAPQAG